MAIVQNVWFFFQDQILGMKWLNALIGNLLTALGLDISSRIGGAVQFFLYDTIKIFVLLSVLIFVISYIQSYFPPERTKKILGRFHDIGANTLAALLGTVTPFCSCSSIPLFIGFTGAGLPLGVTFSFLISSPLVDLGSLVLLTSIFGGKVAIAYVIVGLVLAVLGGSLIERLHLENEVEEFIRKAGRIDLDSPELSLSDRLEYAKDQVVATVKKVAPYIFSGVGIGALIHNFIPQSFVETVLGGDKWYSVPLATLVGVPMYADVCRYLRYYSGCRKSVCKRCRTWNHSFFYDGGNCTFPSFDDHAAKSSKTKTFGSILFHRNSRNYADWIFV